MPPATGDGERKRTMTDVKDTNDRMMPLQEQAWDWVLHMTSGAATKADVAALERWRAQSPRHARALNRASRRWRALGPAMENMARRDGAAGAKAGMSSTRPRGRRAFLGGAIAASAAGAAVLAIHPPLGLWPSVNELAADYRTVTGERRWITLADNLSVEMNTRTSLNVRPAATGGGDRIELIAGEAAIATTSKPVEVIAAGGRTSTDNAQFNIRCDGPEVRVSCLAGSVHVVQHGRSVAVQPRQQVSYTDRGFGPLASIEPAVVAGWRDGDLFFQNEPLSRVIDEVNRYRPGKIVLMNDALGQRRFTARFKLDRLDVVVVQLQATFGARVTTLPGGVVLVS